MRTWEGWTATIGTTATRAPTWSEWRLQLQGNLSGEQRQDEQRQNHGTPFSQRQLARLSFVRWLYLTGRLGPREQDTD